MGISKYETSYDKEQRLRRENEAFAFLKDEIVCLNEEKNVSASILKKSRSSPLIVGQYLESVDENTAIATSSSGTTNVVHVLSIINREHLKKNMAVALHRHSNAIVEILPSEFDNMAIIVGEERRPTTTYMDIGGLDVQKQEIREAIELPLLEFDMYKKIGIDPPRGVLLYGPPGTGKTMLVKAVANATNAAFFKINGSEFIQKYLGEGPRMVRDVFRIAREKAPSIVFIDEIDSIAIRRFDAATSADREVQRVLLELLNQMDGFDQSANVKVIMATNRADIIDPALMRPGRLDRKIEFSSPDRRQKRLIFSTITAKMSLAKDVDLDVFAAKEDNLTGALIHAICQEAGMRAIRNNRYVILQEDFEYAYSKYTKATKKLKIISL